MLKEIYAGLSLRYSNNTGIIERHWEEIEKRHQEPTRHYHTLDHLQSLYEELFEARSMIVNWDALLFALFYHDMVYDPTSSTNEQDSADIAVNNMRELNVREELIGHCKQIILATKTHVFTEDADTNLFTDADLSILGRSSIVYQDYVNRIRKEYAFFPDLIYYPGRKKVLEHFIQMDAIFKTGAFYSKYEKQARENINEELQQIAHRLKSL